MRFRFPRISDAKDHIITALLLVLSLALILGRYQGGIDNMRKVSVTLFSYLEEPLSNIRIYREALKTNTYLRRQNVLLNDELSRLRSAGQRNEELRRMLEFRGESDMELFPVQVVGKELNQINNFLTVDAGARDGIREGMPMITAEGLAGKVILTAGSYSEIMPFQNTLFRVSARLQGTGDLGIVSSTGEPIPELVMDHVPNTVQVDTGEVVVTSGYSNSFPADLPIGTVIRTRPLEGKETQRIFIRPFVNLRTIAEGFIVTFTPDTTLQRLNEEYEDLFE